MTPSTIESNSRMALMFNESQRKYKCCCGCMQVRTGAAIIAALKMFGVLMAIMDLLTGPYFTGNIPNGDDDRHKKAVTDMSQSLDPQSDDNAVSPQSNDDDTDNLKALRTASTVLYLLLEAVAVSCLIYAIRRERPKFVIPEMAFISVCLSLQIVAALLIIAGAAFGSDSLVQVVVNRMRSQGMQVDPDDIDQIRRILPYVLSMVAFMLLIGAAFELWFLMVLRAFYRYLRDKAAFGAFNNDVIIVQHCYTHGGYEPMVEETGSDDIPKNKDTPPKYQEVFQQQEEAAAAPPPSYAETTKPAADQK